MSPVMTARRHLRSGYHQLLAVQHFRLNTYGRRAFQLPFWNSLPDFTRDPTISADRFKRLRIRSVDNSAHSAR